MPVPSANRGILRWICARGYLEYQKSKARRLVKRLGGEVKMLKAAMDNSWRYFSRLAPLNHHPQPAQHLTLYAFSLKLDITSEILRHPPEI
jgi:hypothetical protein